MPDSPRIKEIHEEIFKLKDVLGSAVFKAEQDAGKNPKNIYEKVTILDLAFDAEKYSKDEKDSTKSRVVNLGWLIEKLAMALGLSFESDGEVRAIRQKGVIKSGQPIPNGWKFGQFGLNSGSQYQKGTTAKQPQGERLGIVYECRANQIVPDPNNKGQNMIAEGDYVLCENLIQYLDEEEDDKARALGWDELGAIAVPSADGKKTAVFEGLHSMIIEILYMVSALSENTSQTHIATLVNQAVTQEMLKQLGLPIVYKTFEVDVGTDTNGRVPYPAIKENVPSNYEQFSMILQNLGLLLGEKLRGGNDSIMEASNVDNSPPSSTPIPPQFIQNP